MAPCSVEHRDGVGDRRGLLPDGDVDALHPLALLIDDRVDRDRRLARLAVADDQLALTTADRDQRVDRFDARLHRLVHRLASGDARRLDLHAARLDVAGQRTAPVERLAQRAHDTTEQPVADRHRQDASGGEDGCALLDVAAFAEDHRADRLFVEVQRQAQRAVFELEQIVHRGAGQTRDACDAVADLEHATDLGDLDRRA